MLKRVRLITETLALLPSYGPVPPSVAALLKYEPDTNFLILLYETVLEGVLRYLFFPVLTFPMLPVLLQYSVVLSYAEIVHNFEIDIRLYVFVVKDQSLLSYQITLHHQGQYFLHRVFLFRQYILKSYSSHTQKNQEIQQFLPPYQSQPLIQNLLTSFLCEQIMP